MEYKIVTAGKETLYTGQWTKELEQEVNAYLAQGWIPQGHPFMDPQGYLSQALVRITDAKLSTGHKETVETDDSNDT